MMDMKALEDLENSKMYIKAESLDDETEIKIDSSGLTITPINFPSLGEYILKNVKHEHCDFGCNGKIGTFGKKGVYYGETELDINKKEGENMKLLNMYVEKSEKNIKDYYEKLLEEEYEDRGVVKEFKALCEKFQEDLAKLAEKTISNECKLVELDWEDFEPGYGIECNPTKEELEIREKQNEEFENLHDKIDEVQAQLEIVTSDENSSHHDINYVLYNYGIVDDANKLTPYTPTFVGKESPKKAGRPKKVSE